MSVDAQPRDVSEEVSRVSDSSRAIGSDTCAVANVIENLEDGVEEVINVLLEQAGHVVVLRSDVVQDEVVVRGAELKRSESASRRCIRVQMTLTKSVPPL